MDSSLFIGIDVGTTSIKGVVADEHGAILAAASSEYFPELEGDRCEIAPEIYWQKTKAVIHDLLRGAEVKGKELRSLAFSSQGETLICVDNNGVPLRKAIVWLDNRSVGEAKRIEAHFGREEICLHTGQTHVQPLWPGTRILWLRENEADTFRRVHKFLMVEDYLLFRLTGKYVSEQTLVSSTLYYDIRRKQWWADMLSWLRISEAQLPQVYPSGTLVGPPLQEAADETGLPQNIQVITGAYDHVAGAIGAGNFSEGVVTETTGSSMAMVVTLDKPVNNISFNVPLQCHAVEGKYLLLPYGQTAGLVLKWFKEQFWDGCKEQKTDNAYSQLDELASKISLGADGLVMLPHLSGSGSPEFDASAKGVFAGITTTMSKAHFIRAILESIACMMTRNLCMLQKAGIQVQEIRALGGGAKSALWNQIKADMANVKIVTVQGQETAALGAAILAAKGAGAYPSTELASRKMVKLNASFLPDSKRHQQYRHVYDRYVKLSDTLQQFWRL